MIRKHTWVKYGIFNLKENKDFKVENLGITFLFDDWKGLKKLYLWYIRKFNKKPDIKIDYKYIP